IGLVLQSNQVDACGMTTHNEVGRRAYNFSSFQEYPQYSQMILNNLASFQAGTAFPDWGYNCGGFGDESEAAHWPPFLRNATEYLLKKYEKPWNEDGQRLAVFMLGVMSHQVADISWHSIQGIKNGLIASMAGQDFNGTYDVAHSNADAGGEFVLAYNYNLDFLRDEWYVPVADVKEIYFQMNYTKVTETALVVKCNSELFAGAMGVKTGGKFLYPEIAGKSPFLVDHYQDYFNGGLDDMAVWTSYCWPVLMGWMEGNTIGNFCLIDPAPINGSISPNVVHDFEHLEELAQAQKLNQIVADKLTMAAMDHVSIDENGNGGYTFKFQNAKELQQELGLEDNFQFHTVDRAHEVEANFSIIFSNTPYSYFGRELVAVDLNGDGADDIVVSAPGDGAPGAMQTGCVYYIILGEKNSTQFVNSGEFEISKVANGMVCGTEIHARFGWSTVVVDFNLDGVLDLVVGAPSSGNAELNYQGKVYIYLGELSGETYHLAATPLIISGDDFQDQAGQMLFTGDCNGDGHDDLILGMPTAAGGGDQRGKVAVFYSSDARSNQWAMTVEQNSDYIVNGTNDFEWFGYHVAVTNSTNGNSMLLVGSPTFHFPSGTDMDMGKITGFTSGANNEFAVVPKFTLTGHYKYDKLGYNFDVVDGAFLGMQEPLLVVALPTRGTETEPQVGQVVVIEFTTLSGAVSMADVSSLLDIGGDTMFSRFGASFLFDFSGPKGPLSPSLYIGAPLWTDNLDTGSGAVYTYQLSTSMHTSPKDGSSRLVSTVDGGSYFNNKQKDSRFGFKMVMADINSDGKKDLIVGADRDSSMGLQCGSLNIFFS
ncbi:hypothetical protein SAMD00019534_041900, partial [Acytostelium subglobosum LB1]|uniref:hypothetical protein n=1 Tax=Acytostelium subglobosum LB1 TaxID=1410327 RepID=UPI000644A495